MKKRSTALAIALSLFGLVAFLQPTPAFADRAPRTGLPTARAADRFMERVGRRERRFYQAGVGYDGATGMTFDGHEVDFKSGKLRGQPRAFSAASKESLHLILLTKALTGEHLAEVLMSPDVKQPKLARAAALDVLERKISTYEQFDRDYPGYGGFLPWYKVDQGKIAPTADWQTRVPGLDNGQLAWSLYLTANTLKDLGETKLAARYEHHLEKMRANVVRMFYDPTAKKMRAEATLGRSNTLGPTKNRYLNKQKDYFLDDSYEGLLLCHFADLMGDWSAHPEGKEAVFASPRRKPVALATKAGAITTSQGHWFSSHEDWGYLVLPFRDVPVVDTLFRNSQRARTAWSASHGWNGLMASTHQPVDDNQLNGYVSALGISPIGKLPTVGRPIFAPYASFPLALVDKPLFVSWLSSMMKAPGMNGPYGIGESFSDNGTHAPVLTWDGKALPLVAFMGGIGPDVAKLLKRDGLYDRFRTRVEHDFARFDGVSIKGSQLPYTAPPSVAAAQLGSN